MEEYIRPIIVVCKNVFKETLDLDLEEERPFFTKKESWEDCDLSAVIGITGGAHGAVIISMKKKIGLQITEKLTGLKYTDIDDDVQDAVGEIINIIAGNIKQSLNDLSHLDDSSHLFISLPTVIRNSEKRIKWPVKESARILCIPFKIFKDESFFLSVTLEKNNEA
ncbi:chemotaxis protein CheX [Spirochaetia bacterium]|nr:chemotaxis protein CheX [Spirochaetia bacterium]GHV21669.1 chemotaxis protein CheX [Spirochaetia bacterium]